MEKLKIHSIKKDFISKNGNVSAPAIILEISGCNLKCLASNDEICQYAYPKNEIEIEWAINFIKKNAHIKNLIIKGGEPLLYKKELEKFLKEIYKNDLEITIHTNGTLPILNPLTKDFKIHNYIVTIGERHFPEPGFKMTHPVTGKDFVFGTNDIDNMPKLNISAIRDICICSPKYFLVIKKPVSELKMFLNEFISAITNTGTDFYNDYLKKYPILPNIVCVPISDEEQQGVKDFCTKHNLLYSDNLI